MSNLMSFEDFADSVRESIKEYLPDDYANAEINVGESRKINSHYHSMTISKEGQNVSPSVNLDQMYAEYQKTGEIGPVLQEIAEIARMEPDGIDVHKLDSYEQAKDSLFIRVSNAETNKDFLQDVPHETIGDLAVTYHVMMGMENGEVGSTTVTNTLMEKFGITEAQLKADAMENSSKILSPSLESMNNIMARLLGMDGLASNSVPFEQAVEAFNFRDEGMFVLTNTTAVNGAAVMFYPEVMEQLGAHAGGDMFVIPSSVHEVILVPDDGVMNRMDLEKMIRDINANEVDPKDRLSDSLYHYDTKDHKLERAVDFEERKEMEKTIGRNVEKTSIKDKLKSAEARVNEQMTVPKPAKAHALE